MKKKLKLSKKIIFPVSMPYISKKDIYSVNKTLKTGWISSDGPEIKKFENKFSNYVDRKFSIAVSSGTAALEISIKALGIKKNDEVLIPTLNFPATSNVTIYCGAIPHFIDVEEKTLGINFEKLDKYLKNTAVKKGKYFYNKKTKRRIKALVPTHIFGHSGNLKDLIKIAKKFKLTIIEDASEALGSFYKKKHLGTFGSVGALSFNGNKIITTGSGGAILLKKRADYIKAKKLINVSKINHKWKLIYKGLGYNYKMSNIQASLGCAQFNNIEKIISYKYKLLEKYKKSFRGFSQAKIFELKKSRRSNYWLQTLILDKNISKIKNSLLSKANSENIMLRPVWNLMHTLPYLKKYPKMNLSTAINLEKKIINLPSSIYV